MHRSRSQVAEELTACIRCNECLVACPAFSAPIAIKTLNRETLAGPISPDVASFAKACYQCGACVPVCPVGLHRDAMMLWLKMRLLRGNSASLETANHDAGFSVFPDTSQYHREFDRYSTRMNGDPGSTAQSGRRATSWR
jgi:Na+-translocating ferredoxin:NAD+ oxidoreductase RnfC subunit